MKNKLNIIIEDDRWKNFDGDVRKISRKVFDVAIKYLNSHDELDFLPNDKPIEINLCLSNDDNVHELNREFRSMDKPTNVLSFANVDDENFLAETASQNEIELGDIIIAFETMEREAVLENITFNAHYCHLLTHGILHLCGFDHQEDDEAEYMEALEVKILAELNIDNPYKDDK